jgi:hypothetical protein
MAHQVPSRSLSDWHGEPNQAFCEECLSLLKKLFATMMPTSDEYATEPGIVQLSMDSIAAWNCPRMRSLRHINDGTSRGCVFCTLITDAIGHDRMEELITNEQTDFDDLRVSVKGDCGRDLRPQRGINLLHWYIAVGRRGQAMSHVATYALQSERNLLRPHEGAHIRKICHLCVFREDARSALTRTFWSSRDTQTFHVSTPIRTTKSPYFV